MPGPDELNIRQFGSRKWFFSCIFAQQQISAPARKECNKYDLTAAPHFGLVNRNDCSKWFAIGSSHLFVVPILVLWAGLQKSI
jgi:hypothetical protein